MKFQNCFPILLSAILLCGCAKAKQAAPETVATTFSSAEIATAPSETAPVSTASSLSVENQLLLVYENIDTWHALEETDGWCYAVTDMDGNGRLEILSSETHGTGHFTTFRAWEVGEDGTSLVPIAEDGEYESPVVMGSTRYDGEGLSTDAVDKFTDADGKSYYIQTDDVKDGAAHYYETKSAVFLENGKINRKILGFKQTEYLDGGANCVVTYQSDVDGAEISEAEYNAPSRLSGMEHTTAQIGWLVYVHTQNMTQALLNESYLAFSG